MPQILYTTKDEIPSDLVGDAVEIKEEGENKGKWGVNVVSRKKLEEFRDNNVQLSQKLEQSEGLVKKVVTLAGVENVEDFDFGKFSEGYSALTETARKVADGKLKESGDIDKVVEERTAAMRQKFDDQLRQAAVEAGKMKAERDEAVGKYKQTFIDRAVSSAVADTDLGVEGTAIDDIMARARNVFVVEEDGSITPKKNGQTMWGEDGSTAMSMKEWISLVLRKEAPHYFIKSRGGNASGGGDGAQYGGMSEDEFNALPASQRLAIANKGSVSVKRSASK